MKENHLNQATTLEPSALQPQRLKAARDQAMPGQTILPPMFLPFLRSAAAWLLCGALFGALLRRLHAQPSPEPAPLDTWHWRMPLPQGNNLTAIAYGHGLYAAVGEGDQVVWSTDAVHWASCELPVAREFVSYWDVDDIVFGNGLFVATFAFDEDELGENFTMVSSDGFTWTRRSEPLPSSLYTLAYGQGVFIGGGDQELLYSNDGLTWAPTTIALTNQEHYLSRLAYGDGTFLAFAPGRSWPPWSYELWRSENGIQFNPVTNAFPGLTFPGLGGLAYGAGQFVALAVGGPARSYTSTNGRDWAMEPVISGFAGAFSIQSLAYGSGRFVALGTDDAGSFSLLSTNGSLWELQRLPIDSALLGGVGLAWGSAGFVAVGRSGVIFTSTNGLQWEARVEATRKNFRDVVWQDGLYVAVGNHGKVFTSTNGETWTQQDAGTDAQLRSVAWGNGQFTIVGEAGVILTSTHGAQWTSVLPSPARGLDLCGLTFAAGEFVAVGDGGIILTSSDGLSWHEARAPGGGERLQGIGYGGGLFVATGRQTHSSPYGEILDDSLILTSPDAVTWTRQTGPRISYLESVAYGKGVYVTVGDSLTILTSSNGVDWRMTSPLDVLEVGNELEAVTFANGIFLVVGNDGLILSSPDGYNWTQRYSGFSSRNLRSVIYANGVFTTVGNNDTILQSGNVLPRLAGLMRPDGFELTVRVEPGCVWSVEATADFANWVPVATVTNLQFSHTWVDHQATNYALRFYRLTSP